MRRFFKGLLVGAALCALLAVGLPGAADAAETGETAVADPTLFYVNDRFVPLIGYNIEGHNYYKLRDVAYALSGTQSHFDVGWNAEKKQVALRTGHDYDETELPKSVPTRAKATVAKDAILLDGKQTSLAAYNIGGSNYFKLRDLGEQLGFSVFWSSDERGNFVAVYTGVGQGVTAMERSAGTLRYEQKKTVLSYHSDASQDHLFENADGTLSVLSQSGGRLYCDVYSRDFSQLLRSQEIPMQLSLFGGFYAGRTNYFIVFGEENADEIPNKEVLRIVKYDKSFNELGHVSLTSAQCYTRKPFRSGSCAIVEGADGLVIHTSRLRLKNEEGLNHQSQLTIVLDPATMKVKNDLGAYQGNHVTHSFTQRAQYNGNHFALVDLGDGYPRSVVLSQYNGKGFDVDGYEMRDLFAISGEIGENYTGVKVGGFEITPKNYLLAISTVDQRTPSAAERDVVMLSCGRNLAVGAAVNQVKLTNYTGSGRFPGEPKLVRIADDRYLVMWAEYETASDRCRGVNYLLVDGAGRAVGQMKTLKDAHLSDCQPLVVDGYVVWHAEGRGARLFYRVGPF